MLSLAVIRLRTIFALGVVNVVRVLLFKMAVGAGAHPVCHRRALPPKGPYFRIPEELVEVAAEPTSNWQHSIECFGWYRERLKGNELPKWLESPFSKAGWNRPLKSWWKIPDFDSQIGDVKAVWELSRFGWALAFAQRGRKGSTSDIRKLNGWIADWWSSNPPYLGPNWKCGQEASFRVMRMAVVALLLKQVETAELGILESVDVHVRRIDPTVGYALAQDNNHGTSEAAALFIGGEWLRTARSFPGADSWAKRGRTLLEKLVARLIQSDGSFSQYSLNYHRLLVDTLCVVEVWRRHLDLPLFTDRFYAKARLATEWLESLVDPKTGDAPTLGANDGAHLLELSNTGYRDYRPTIQLASLLFAERRAFGPPGSYDDPGKWLGLRDSGTHEPARRTRLFDKGGICALHAGDSALYLRFPKFRFRPSEADALHVDLWLGGENTLRDAGTFSYFDIDWLKYLSGPESHNTVQFDCRNQMPRLGRFLFGAWPDADTSKLTIQGDGTYTFSASYSDYMGASHQRSIVFSSNQLLVVDRVSGFQRKAVLRWRLAPNNWLINGFTVSGSDLSIDVDADVPLVRLELTEGWESRYYLKKSRVPVVEAEIQEPGVFTTQFRWQQ